MRCCLSLVLSERISAAAPVQSPAAPSPAVLRAGRRHAGQDTGAGSRHRLPDENAAAAVEPFLSRRATAVCILYHTRIFFFFNRLSSNFHGFFRQSRSFPLHSFSAAPLDFSSPCFTAVFPAGRTVLRGQAAQHVRYVFPGRPSAGRAITARISSSARRTSYSSSEAGMRCAPRPRMMSCSRPSEVATRTRWSRPSSYVVFSMYMSAVSASFVYTTQRSPLCSTEPTPPLTL